MPLWIVSFFIGGGSTPGTWPDERMPQAGKKTFTHSRVQVTFGYLVFQCLGAQDVYRMWATALGSEA